MLPNRILDDVVSYDVLNHSPVQQDILAAAPIHEGVGAFNVSSLPKWSAAVRAQKAGTRNARLLLPGDSTMAGVGSNGALVTNGKANSWPSQLKPLVAGSSIASMMADSGFGPFSGYTFPDFDPRATLGSGISNGQPTVGGILFAITSTGTFDLAIPTNCDTFEVYYAALSGGGTLTFAFDGGAVVDSVSTNAGVNGYAKRTIPVALGAHTLKIGKTGGTAYIGQIIAYNSAVKEISILNAGWQGSTVADWASVTNAWSAGNTIDDFAPDLSIICLTINDWNNGTARATYRSNLSLIVDTCVAAGGDVLLMSGAPSDPSTLASYATQQNYIDDCNTVIAAKSLPPLINPWLDVFGGVWNAGLMYDARHPNGTGYAGIASLVKSRIGF